jgi:hypothetical protein
MLDIRSDSPDPRCARLSNFTRRPFKFDYYACGGIEGILQSLKIWIPETQRYICSLSGKEAKLHGGDYDHWKETQQLWWRRKLYERSSRKYYDLITSIYDAVYEQDPNFKEDLLAIGYEDIGHSIGNPDMRDTVLTEVEMIHQLNRLRIRALKDQQ